MKTNAKMKFQSWKTTDEEERATRRERASIESMKVREINAPDGFGVYEVSHPAARRSGSSSPARWDADRETPCSSSTSRRLDFIPSMCAR